MSILLDKLLKEADTSTTVQTKDLKWYIAKPLTFYSIKSFFNRLKDSIRVLLGKSFAVHYKQDEKIKIEIKKIKQNCLELTQQAEMHEEWTKHDVNMSVKDHFIAGAEYQKKTNLL